MRSTLRYLSNNMDRSTLYHAITITDCACHKIHSRTEILKWYFPILWLLWTISTKRKEKTRMQSKMLKISRVSPLYTNFENSIDLICSLLTYNRNWLITHLSVVYSYRLIFNICISHAKKTSKLFIDNNSNFRYIWITITSMRKKS